MLITLSGVVPSSFHDQFLNLIYPNLLVHNLAVTLSATHALILNEKRLWIVLTLRFSNTKNHNNDIQTYHNHSFRFLHLFHLQSVGSAELLTIDLLSLEVESFANETTRIDKRRKALSIYSFSRRLARCLCCSL